MVDLTKETPQNGLGAAATQNDGGELLETSPDGLSDEKKATAADQKVGPPEVGSNDGQK